MRRGRLAEAEGFLREGLRLADRVGSGLPVHWDAACLLIDTLLARGRTAEARLVADRYDFGPPYPSAMVLPDAPCVRAGCCWPKAVRRTPSPNSRRRAPPWSPAVASTASGHRGPADLARALADDDPVRAAQLAARARVHAERFGTDTAIGEALRCVALFAPAEEAEHLLAEAVHHLEASSSAYEHALARLEYGIAIRSPRELARAQKLAVTCGAEALATRAQQVRTSIRSSE